MFGACNILKTFINHSGVIGNYISILLNFNIMKDHTNNCSSPVECIFTTFHDIHSIGSKLYCSKTIGNGATVKDKMYIYISFSLSLYFVFFFSSAYYTDIKSKSSLHSIFIVRWLQTKSIDVNEV